MLKARLLGAVGIAAVVGGVLMAQAPHTVLALYAQALTIPQRAVRQAPGPLVFTIQSELLSVTFEKLATQADLIIQGTVTKLRSYLSDDQLSIYTDYRVAPREVLWDGSARGSATPGVAAAIVVKRLGGTLVINGVEVTELNEDLSPIDKEEGVLFLRKDRDPSKFRLVHELEGVFYVRDGRMFPAHDVPAYAPVTEKTTTELQADVLRLKR